MKIIVHLSFWNNISERENGLAQRKNTEIFFIHKKTVHKKTKRTSNILRLRNFVKRLIDSEIVLFFAPDPLNQHYTFQEGWCLKLRRGWTSALVFYGWFCWWQKRPHMRKSQRKPMSWKYFWSGQRDKSGICQLASKGPAVILSAGFIYEVFWVWNKRYGCSISPSCRWRWKIEIRDVFKSIYIHTLYIMIFI